MLLFYQIFYFNLNIKGHLRLVQALGVYYSKIFEREINPLNQILITVGSYGSLYNAFSSLLQKNDEVKQQN